MERMIVEATISRMKAALGRTILCAVAWCSASATAAEIDPRFDAKQLRDIYPGINDSFPHSFTEFGGSVFFFANSPEENFLWRTNGSAAGTFPAITETGFYVGRIQSAGGNLFVSAYRQFYGHELWLVDDGTTGVQLVRDINILSGSNPDNFMAINDALLFTADDGDGFKMWVSRGSELSTQPIADIFGGVHIGVLDAYSVFEGRLYFAVQVSDSGASRRSFWASDGTREGTTQLLAITDDNGTQVTNFFEFKGRLCVIATQNAQPVRLLCFVGDTFEFSVLSDRLLIDQPDVAVVDDIFFFSALSDTLGREIGVSDGTQNGTRIFTDLNPGYFGSSPGGMIVADNKVFFIATLGTFPQSQVWMIDPRVGSSATALTAVSPEGFAPSFLVDFNGSIVAFAENSDGKLRILLLDGHQLEMQTVMEFEDRSFVHETKVIGQSLFFSANAGDGIEPWVWHNRPPIAVADEFRIKGGRWESIDVLANDSDIDGALDRNSIEIVEEPRYGRLEATDSGLRYKRLGRWQGSDRFSYRVRDTQGAESGVVDVTINPGGGGGSMQVWMVFLLLLLTYFHIAKNFSWSRTTSLKQSAWRSTRTRTLNGARPTGE